MPSRNVIKEQAPESYYHVYARGSNKQHLFIDDRDYRHFLGIFERYLSVDTAISKTGEIYPNFRGRIEIVAYCLMPSHFHILVYQKDTPFLEKFMQSLMTSYSRYYNLKYKRTGPVFGSRYKASRIDQDSYLLHVSRYIHLNPRSWRRYEYSSIDYYCGKNKPVWLNTDAIMSQFGGKKEYLEFVSDYEDMHNILDEIKDQLIDS